MKTRFTRTPISLCCALLAAGALPALAQDETTLSTVVVTATGYEQQIKEAPASISVITREQLETQPFTNLEDAVRHVEGVSVVGSNPGDTDIAIRGMPGEYTLILVDGKRQNTRETMNRGTGGVQANQIPPLEAIERIEVVRGPMSSLYGSDAMGGVINIITRKVPAQWSGSVSLGTIIQQDADYGDTRQGDFWVGGPLASGLMGLQVYGNYSDRDEDGINYPNDTNWSTPGTRDKNLNAKLTITPTDNQDITLEAGRNTLTYITTPGKSVNDRNDAGKDEHERTNWAITHNGRWGFGSTMVSLYQEKGVQSNYTDGEKDMDDREIVNTTLDALATLPFSNNVLKLGMQYADHKLDGLSQESPVPGKPASADRLKNRNWALFVEDEFFVTDRFSLTGGVRLDDDDRYGSHWTPRLYGVYKLTEAWTLRGGVATGFKAPTLRQTAESYCMRTGRAGSGMRPGVLCGNPDLKPEESVTEEIGIRYDDPRGTSFSVTAFNNDFKNKVVSYDTGERFNASNSIYIYDNIDKVNIRGVELAGAWPVNPQWTLSGNYTFTKSRREGGGEPAYDGGSLDGRPLDKTPEHMANARVDWMPFEKLSTYARVTYTGTQYWAAFRNGANNVRERESSTTFDLGGSYVINKMFTVNVAVLNLTDEIVPVDDRPRAELDGNWMVDEGRRYWLNVKASF
ncbi:TonB-dependent receptor domain-containing protein [Chitiniphilus eburneus]|nr:TonB-dependent receptor [Chitiniphilus eburneus]